MINMCRLCLAKKSVRNIFEVHKSILILTKIMAVAQVEIHPDDGLPNSICNVCLKKLDISYKFKLQCEDSDKRLKKAVQSQNTNKEETMNLIEVKDICEESQKKTDMLEMKCNYSEDSMFTEDDECENFDNKLVNEDNITRALDAKTKKEKQQCFTCGKVMSSRFRLITHLRTHTGEKPYICSDCDKRFSSAQNLKIHMRTHTGEKPLTCKICGHTFAHGAGLTAHTRKHTGETPYQCTLCPRTFRTNGHYQYHVRQHTGEKKFDCKTCGRAFITKSDLNKHSLIHSGERPHVCSTCGLRLLRASHLKRHMAVHNKCYTCDQCDAKFVQKTCLQKHRRKHCDASVPQQVLTANC